jgi:hypothetical protein
LIGKYLSILYDIATCPYYGRGAWVKSSGGIGSMVEDGGDRGERNGGDTTYKYM